MVIAGGEGSNLGLALAGQHSVIRRVGQCYRDKQWPSLLTMSLHNHTAAAAHWNQTLSVSAIYITPQQHNKYQPVWKEVSCLGNRDVAGK